MSWVTKFQAYKEQGKSTEWLITRANSLFQNGYINQIEYDEIIAAINE